MHLARREMAIAVQEWLAVIPDFELDSDASCMERGGGAMMALEHAAAALGGGRREAQVTTACQGHGRCYSLAPQFLDSPTTRGS